MNKLQLYITRSYEGFNHLLDINADDQVKRHVTDIRPALSAITYDTEKINFYYLLRYTDQGVFLTIIRTIPSEAGNHLAAWIYVPSTLSVPESDLENTVRTIVEIIANPKITTDQVETMRSLMDKEYEPIPSPAAIVGNKGDEYAHRYYGADTGYELSDFLGNKKYQTSYLPYAGVILAEKTGATTISGPDLTDEPLEQMVKIFPPKLGLSAYRPSIFGKAFDRPYLVPLMGTVEVTWEAPGVITTSQSILITRPNMRPDAVSAPVNPAPKAEIAAPVAAPELPAAAPQKAEEPTAQAEKPQEPVVEGTQPQANIEAVSPQAPIVEAVLPQVPTVEAEQPQAPEAEQPQAPAVEAEQPQAPEVQAAPAAEKATEDTKTDVTEPRALNYDRQRVYNFEIPAKSADISSTLTFTVRTRSTLTGSPIDGYELSEPIQEGPSRSNHLIYMPQGGLNNKIIYAIIGFVAGVALTLLSTCAFGGKASDSNATDSDSTAVEAPVVAEVAQGTAEKPADTPQQPTDTSLPAAIKYLDTNMQWDKATLESYPDLRGLYNDMNTFNKKRLIDHWAPKLKDSRRFANIAKHAKLGMKKAPRTPKGQTTFNKPNEGTIKIQSYLNTIDP